MVIEKGENAQWNKREEKDRRMGPEQQNDDQDISNICFKELVYM